MAEGTLIVMTFVAKQDKLFTAADCHTDTGLDRQLVYYHLNNFVKNGYLEKVMDKYCVVDRNKLIEGIAYGKVASRKKKAKATSIYTEHNAEALNRSIELCIQARRLGVEGARDLKEALNMGINQTVETLNDAKRALNTSHRSVAKAIKQVQEDEGWLDDYMGRLDYFNIEHNKDIMREVYERNINS